MTSPPRAEPAPAGEPADPFARLVQELMDSDYTWAEPVTPDIVHYRMATASDLLATIERTGTAGVARLAPLGADGTRTWEVTCTAGTPPAVQTLLLFAVLLADAGTEQDVLRSIADALRIDLDTEPGTPDNTAAG